MQSQTAEISSDAGRYVHSDAAHIAVHEKKPDRLQWTALKAWAIVTDLRSQGVNHVYLEGYDEVIDILRLICIEAGLGLD